MTKRTSWNLRFLIKIAFSICLLTALVVPLQGCAVGLVAGYLIAKGEQPKQVTTCSQTGNAPQSCTTTTQQ